jgi:catechol 2,3-dioxygenase-like lactoylglutathione lyase family enzyme
MSELIPSALWVPFEVSDLDAATRFYTERVGLSVVDSWYRDGERGVVLRVADGAFIELVSPGAGHPGPLLAFEQTNRSEVDERFANWPGEAEAPYRHPRGHYGFTAPGPAGVKVMVWSER